MSRSDRDLLIFMNGALSFSWTGVSRARDDASGVVPVRRRGGNPAGGARITAARGCDNSYPLLMRFLPGANSRGKAVSRSIKPAGQAITTHTNDYGQEVGFPIPDWTTPNPPAHVSLVGRSCRVEPLSVADNAAALFAAFTVADGDTGWTYLPYGPFDTRADFEDWINRTCLTDDPLFFAIVDADSGAAVGFSSYLNIRPLHGTIEV